MRLLIWDGKIVRFEICFFLVIYLYLCIFKRFSMIFYCFLQFFMKFDRFCFFLLKFIVFMSPPLHCSLSVIDFADISVFINFQSAVFAILKLFFGNVNFWHGKKRWIKRNSSTSGFFFFNNTFVGRCVLYHFQKSRFYMVNIYYTNIILFSADNSSRLLRICIEKYLNRKQTNQRKIVIF